MKKKVLSILVLATSLVWLLVGCISDDGAGKTGETEKKEELEKLEIVTSISIVADIVENIVGERGKVDYIVPIGEEPEEYEPVPSDFQKASKADVLFINGYNLERWLENLMANVTEVPVVPLAETGPTIPLETGKDIADPHLWLDVNLVEEYYVDNALKKLVKLDPEEEDYYNENAAKYRKELKELNEWIKEEVEKIKQKNRVIITSENCFKYFGEAYGFEVDGIWEINSQEEGTPQQISRVVNKVKDNELPALFVETTVDPRYMEMVESETGVEIAGEVYSDATGKEGSEAHSYITKMEHNVNKFVKGLK